MRLPDDMPLRDGDGAVRLHDGRWYAALDTKAMRPPPRRRHARWLRGEAALYDRPRGGHSGRAVLEGRDRDPGAGETVHGEVMVAFTGVVREYGRWPRGAGRMGAVMECLPDGDLPPLALAHPYPRVREAALRELRGRSAGFVG